MMPEVAEGVAQLDRVVVELALVEDAAHPGAEKEVLVGQDLVPELLDGRDLGEEAVAADVEAPTVPLHGAADASDHRVLLHHHHRVPRLGQQVGGGEPGRSTADDHHRRSGRGGRSSTGHR